VLRDARRRQGWTIRDLAERTGIHQSYLAGLERGAVARPGLLMLVRLAHGFVALRAARLAYVALLAMSYAGETPVPPLASRSLRRR
jgi:transcriptional regulator with XRE-family HTH domain